MATHDIYIYPETGGTASGIRIPWLPSEIKFDLGGVRFEEYEIVDVGEVNVPNGSNLANISFSSVFPGKARKGLPFLRGSFIEPKTYQSKLTSWMTNGTKLKVLVTGTPINHKVFITEFVPKYSGAYGDINYDITLKTRRDITVKTIKKSTTTSSTKKKTTATTKTTYSSYTIKSGDTLWAIARKKLGKGSRWKEIYNLNKTIIEKTAKKHGRKSSSSGHWIYPGTKIKLPKK